MKFVCLTSIAVLPIFAGCIPTHNSYDTTRRRGIFNSVYSTPLGTLTMASEAELLSTEANTRTILMYKIKTQNDDIEHIRFLAEPAPDIAQDISQSFRLLIESAAAGKLASEQHTELQGSLDIISRYAQSTAQLTRRSQGVVYFRDASYRLAEAALNDLLTPCQYKELMQLLLEQSAELIQVDIATNEPKVYSSDPDSSPTPEPTPVSAESAREPGPEPEKLRAEDP